MAFNRFEQSLIDQYTNTQFPDQPPEPEQSTQPPGTQPGDVLVAEAGSRGLPESVYTGQSQAQMTAYDPTVRERLSAFLQAGLEGVGVDRYTARKNAQTIMGGPSSNLPLTMGIADIVPFLGTALQTQESFRMGEDAATSLQQGRYGAAALEATGAGLGMIPGIGGTVKGLKAIAPDIAQAIVKGAEELGTPVRGLNVVEPGPNVVSTRLPTAVKATEDPLANRLLIDLQASKQDPEAFAHNIGLIRQYPNFASKARNPDRQAEDFITEVKNNLLYLHDQVPEATRQRSKLWYDGARNIADRFSADYGVPDQAVAGVLAVLSPQKDWFMNVSLGQRVLDIVTKQQSSRWDSSMDDMAKIIWSKPQYAPMVDAIRGKTLAEIQDPGLKAMWLRTYDQAKNPREHQIVSPEGDFVGVRLNANGTPTKTGWGSLNEISKAVVILEDPTLANISSNLGQQHKVRNFYSNIYAPNDPVGPVTIDTHAVAAGLLRPLSGNSREVLHNFGSGVVGEGGPKNSSITGVQGTYGLYAEAYRRAAQERGILPREMQSITWEAVRGLYPDTFKSQAKNVQQIDDIWLQYRKGKLSLEEARNEVFRAAGGIRPPEWEAAGLRGATAPEIQPPANPRELSGAGVPGGGSRGFGRNNTTAGNPAGVNNGQQRGIGVVEDVGYRGSHTAPSREFGAPLNDLTGDGGIYPSDVYSAKGAHIYGDGWSFDRKAFDIASQFKGKPNAMVTIYRAVPSEAIGADINPGDWVTITRDYAKEHGQSVLNGKYKIITKKVKAGDIYTNGDSIHEWGYDPAIKENK